MVGTVLVKNKQENRPQKEEISMEKLKVWKPVQSVTMPIFLQELRYDQKGMKLVVVDAEGYEYGIFYNQNIDGRFVLGARFTDEMKNSYWAEQAKEARSRVFLDKGGWPFYKTKSSDFVDWYDRLPGLGSEDLELTHYLIATVDDTYEVLSCYEPVVHLLSG